ncbi:MAG TPA: hypothetical protein VK158_06150 [Acidobacteriota bacterium]|nr:hypothetical protein [Acidobacteriota bacterium]
MIKTLFDSHIQKRIQGHLEPVRVSFGNVAKDIGRIDQFSKESRTLMERWNQYFLHMLSQLEKKHTDAKVIEHAKTVPKLTEEIAQLHTAHTSLYQSLSKQQQAFDALRGDTARLQASLSQMVGQYNKAILSVVDELQTLKKEVARLSEQPKPVPEPAPAPVSHRKSEDLEPEAPVVRYAPSNTLREIAGSLTTSERAILLILVGTNQKLSYKDISVNYGRSPSTIKNIICRLKSKNIPLHEMTGADGVKRYFLDEHFKKILASTRI